MRVVWRVLVPVLCYELLQSFIPVVWPGLPTMSSVMIGAMAAIILFRIWYREEQKAGGRFSAKTVLKPKEAGYILILGIGACILGNNLIELSRLKELFPQVQMVTEQLYAPPFILQILSVGIVLPIAEELVFRGMVYRRLREACAVRESILFSALLFAVFHGDVVQGIYAFALGLLMAWVYERYAALTAPVVFHIGANLCSVLLTGLAGQYEVNSDGKSFLLVTVLSAAAMLWSAHKIVEEN